MCTYERIYISLYDIKLIISANVCTALQNACGRPLYIDIYTLCVCTHDCAHIHIILLNKVTAARRIYSCFSTFKLMHARACINFSFVVLHFIYKCTHNAKEFYYMLAHAHAHTHTHIHHILLCTCVVYMTLYDYCARGLRLYDRFVYKTTTSSPRHDAETSIILCALSNFHITFQI